MLSQKHRLNKSAEVKKTTARGRSFFNPFFVIKFAPFGQPSSEPVPRLTVIVSTKVSKKAVDRNRIKRVVRDEIRKHLAKIRPGDYAFIMKPQAMKITSAELRDALQKSLYAGKIIV